MEVPVQEERPEIAAGSEAPDVGKEREQYIQKWVNRVKAAKNHWKDDFTRMKDDMKFARQGGAVDQVSSGQYVANIVQRHLNRRVASLYARNPKAIAKRRRRRDFKIWDGNPENIMLAIQTLQQDPLNTTALSLVMDLAQGENKRIMMKRLGETLEILYQHFTDDARPNFKVQLKRLVRRTLTTGIGYLKLGFMRSMQVRPEAEHQLAELAAKLAEAERLQNEIDTGQSRTDADVEALRIQIESVESEAEEIVREGLVFSFPRSTSVIMDPETEQLQGWIGTGWIAEEYEMHPSKIQQVYGVDVRTQFQKHTPDNRARQDEDGKTDMALVWAVQDKTSGTYFTICDGYPDYIEEPGVPEVQLERFFNIYPLVFNDVEDDDKVFPLSDVCLLRPMQEEYNRSRQGLREHRAGNRPKYAAAQGKLSDEDKTKLQSDQANAILELMGLAPGDDVNKLLQRIQPHPIDPALYDTNPVFEDILRVSGTQEANMGPTSGDTATEASIAETSRLSDASSNVDDLDVFLSEVARDASQVLLLQMSLQHVQRIVGDGAVWPTLTRQEIADEMYLEVKAGSSGRPNKAVDLANLERATPILTQLPGLNLTWLARLVIETLDADIDIDEALLNNMPSMVAMNALQGRGGGGQSGTGDPQNDPAQQGGRGGEVNQPKRAREEPGAQPAFPDASAVASTMQ